MEHPVTQAGILILLGVLCELFARAGPPATEPGWWAATVELLGPALALSGLAWAAVLFVGGRW